MSHVPRTGMQDRKEGGLTRMTSLAMPGIRAWLLRLDSNQHRHMLPVWQIT
jgi:hypothetical protein